MRKSRHTFPLLGDSVTAKYVSHHAKVLSGDLWQRWTKMAHIHARHVHINARETGECGRRWRWCHWPQKHEKLLRWCGCLGRLAIVQAYYVHLIFRIFFEFLVVNNRTVVAVDIFAERGQLTQCRRWNRKIGRDLSFFHFIYSFRLNFSVRRRFSCLRSLTRTIFKVAKTSEQFIKQKIKSSVWADKWP